MALKQILNKKQNSRNKYIWKEFRSSVIQKEYIENDDGLTIVSDSAFCVHANEI